MKIILSCFLFLLFYADLKAQDTLNFTKTEIIYGRKDGMALTMLKLLPKKDFNGKAIISVVSGNWISAFANNAERFVNRAKIYIDRGYTVFIVIHSSQPRYTIPDEISDLKRAVRFIRYNAKEYNIDGNHLGITGSSSGGHLSLLVALSDDKVDSTSRDPINKISSRVQAAAVFYPPTDLLNWGAQNANLTEATAALTFAGVVSAFDYKEWNDTIRKYKPVTDAAKYLQITKQISPINSVSADDPPVLIIHGDADKTVPLQQSQSLVQKLNEKKITNRLIIKKDGGHGWKNQDVEEKNMVDWFDKYLK
jgi:acetyl esterase/lipase